MLVLFYVDLQEYYVILYNYILLFVYNYLANFFFLLIFLFKVFEECLANLFTVCKTSLFILRLNRQRLNYEYYHNIISERNTTFYITKKKY